MSFLRAVRHYSWSAEAEVAASHAVGRCGAEVLEGEFAYGIVCQLFEPLPAGRRAGVAENTRGGVGVTSDANQTARSAHSCHYEPRSNQPDHGDSGLMGQFVLVVSLQEPRNYLLPDHSGVGSQDAARSRGCDEAVDSVAGFGERAPPWRTFGGWLAVTVLAIVAIAGLLGGGLTTEGAPTNNPQSERDAS